MQPTYFSHSLCLRAFELVAAVFGVRGTKDCLDVFPASLRFSMNLQASRGAKTKAVLVLNNY